jgi:zinc transport system substrate-binding protein
MPGTKKMKLPHLKLKPLSFILLLLTSILYACQASGQETTSQEMTAQVTVSILPQAYFIERISGGSIAVNVMVGPGEEAHTYEPKPEQMRTLAESQVFFTIGLEYEAVWVPRFKEINPNLEFIDMAKGIQRIPLSTDHAHHDEEENFDDEVGKGLDPHVWLSPENGRIIAKNTLDALSNLMPDSAEIFQENFDALVADIDSVDTQINNSLKSLEQRKFMVFHPAWGYFAKQYDLEQLAVQVGGQDPSASELASLIEIAQNEKIKVIFIQPTFNTASAEAIAQEIGAEVVVVDPLAQDWLSNLESAAAAFKSALNE